MNRQVTQMVRAVIAVIVLIVVVLTVMRWWREYKEAPSLSATPPETTITVSQPDKEANAQAGQVSNIKRGTDLLVVQIDGLNLREKPESNAKPIRGLNEGERLTLQKADGAWFRVETSEGDEGWITSNPSYSKIEKR